MHQQPPPQWGLGGGGGDVNRPMHTSTLRRQMRQPNFDGGGGGGESIYSMLGTEDGMGGGGGSGGKSGASMSTKMKGTVDVQFDVGKGRLLSMKGDMTNTTSLGGMGSMKTATQFTLTRK